MPELLCEHCQRTIEFSGDRPLFCGFCGKPFAGDEQSVATQEFQGSDLGQTPRPPSLQDEEREILPRDLGRYQLLVRLGSGGMGNVYEAQENLSGRRVALKLISPQYASTPQAIERFRQEGRLAGAINHPRCVFVLSADEEQGQPCIAMELVKGETLEDYVNRVGPLPVEKAVPMILDVIEGLQEAHRLGVIHRDVKPSNCFLLDDGRVKIGDFGIAKSLVAGSDLTRTGTFMGTLLYAAPEQIKGGPLRRGRY